MICHNCGSQLPDESRICAECGAEQTLPEMVENIMPDELPASDDFDPRAFAGLDDDADDFDPRAFAGLDLDEEVTEPAAEQTPEVEAEPAAKPKKTKKKRRKGLVALVVIAIVVAVLAAAAGALWWLTSPVDEEMLRRNFTDFAGLEEGEEVTAFTVDVRETDRIGRSDAVWCSVITKTDAIRYDRKYLMAYELTAEGWQLERVDGIETADWTTTPLTGIGLEELQTALVGWDVTAQDDYVYTLTEEDTAQVEILSQTTDLDAKTDQVEASVTVTTDVLAWTVNAQISCSFDESWNIDSLENSQAQLDFKPGMDFDLEQEDFLQALYAEPVTLGETAEEGMMEVITVVDGEAAAPAAQSAQTQTVTVTEQTVSNFSVKDSTFSLEENKQLVECSFELIKDVAELYVEATLVCGHNGSAWEVEEITYDAEVEQIRLIGTWVGTYTESEGRTPKVTVTAATAEDGTEKISFAFEPSEATPYFFYGSYALTAETDTKTMNVNLKPGEWINNPYADMQVVGLNGTLLIDDGVITDGATFTITLQRPEEPAAPAEETAAPTEEAAQPVVDDSPYALPLA